MIAAYPEDQVAIGNWVTLNDNRLRAERRFQILRLSDRQTLFRARSLYACADLTTGCPARMSGIFRTGFNVLPRVTRVLNPQE